MLIAATAGFFLGLSLIVAIGAQNAFVLRQGLRRSHVFAICLSCAASDAALIAAGVGGLGKAIAALPWLTPLMRYGGAAFLFFYSLRSLRAPLTRKAAREPAGEAQESRAAARVTRVRVITHRNQRCYGQS